MNAVTIGNRTTVLTIILVCCGCNAVQRQRAVDYVDLPKIQVFGEFVNDQMVEIPDVGLTLGEALGGTLRDEVNVPSFAVVSRDAERIYLPLPLARDYIGGKITLSLGDSVQVVSAKNTFFGSTQQKTNQRIFLTGLVSQAGPLITSENVKGFGDLIEYLHENNALDNAAEIVEVKRTLGGVVHRMILPTSALQSSRVGGQPLSEIVEPINGVGAGSLLDGDIVEVTRLAFIPEIIGGNVASKTRSLVEKEKLGRRQHRKNLERDKSSGGRIASNLRESIEPVRRRIAATRRLLPRF